MLARKIGIDLGSSSVRVYVRGEGLVVDEPSLAAVDRSASKILAVGSRARELRGAFTEAVEVVQPMPDGVITDLAVAQGMLRYLIKRVQGRQRLFRPEVMLCVPSTVTSLERRALTAAAIAAGARQAWLIDKPLAAAIGCDLPISRRRASAVCHIGSCSTEVAVISQSGMVASAAVPVGGRAIEQPAEAIRKPLREIAAAIHGVIEETPSELVPDLAQRGIVLTG